MSIISFELSEKRFDCSWSEEGGCIESIAFMTGMPRLRGIRVKSGDVIRHGSVRFSRKLDGVSAPPNAIFYLKANEYVTKDEYSIDLQCDETIFKWLQREPPVGKRRLILNCTFEPFMGGPITSVNDSFADAEWDTSHLRVQISGFSLHDVAIEIDPEHQLDMLERQSEAAKAIEEGKRDREREFFQEIRSVKNAVNGVKSVLWGIVIAMLIAAWSSH